jgi:hypothetical protein
VKAITEGIARLENIASVVKLGGGVIGNGKHLRNWPQIFGIHEVRDAKPSYICGHHSSRLRHRPIKVSGSRYNSLQPFDDHYLVTNCSAKSGVAQGLSICKQLLSCDWLKSSTVRLRSHRHFLKNGLLVIIYIPMFASRGRWSTKSSLSYNVYVGSHPRNAAALHKTHADPPILVESASGSYEHAIITNASFKGHGGLILANTIQSPS